MKNTKIVCTMGPQTSGIPRLIELIDAGMNAARLNFSHGTHKEHKQMVKDIKEAALLAKKSIAIIGDLCGPKIRVGQIENGAIDLIENETIILTQESIIGTSKKISHSYKDLYKDIKVNDRVLLDDGLIELKVIEIKNFDIICKIINSGKLKTHKGMNLPDSKLSISSITKKDIEDIALGVELEIDYFALSFVKNAEDVLEAKKYAAGIPIIAKIEMPEAVQNLDAIIDVSDALMVARGDLGVELGHQKVPLVQKRVINAVKRKAIPVITATQMLESMIQNPRPTRAEVSDVANAILDGTDAVMLSAETSVGKYPVEAVSMLTSIIKELENDNSHCVLPIPKTKESSYSYSIAEGVVKIAENLKLAAIAVYSESGKSAALISAQRPKAHIICFSRHDKILKRLAIFWGIRPLFGEWVKGVDGVVYQAQEELLKRDLVKFGDDIAITFGMKLKDEKFQTNMLKLWKIV